MTAKPGSAVHAFIVLMVMLLAVSGAALGQAADTDGDGIPDGVEAKLGMDPAFKDALRLIHDDGAKGVTDGDCGNELVPGGDFTRIYFCPVARMRYLWKIEFAAELTWPPASYDALILYVDADNNRDTGRRDKEWARGTDMMLRPVQGAQMFEWPGVVKAASCADGNALYMVADIGLNQKGGQSAYRITFLFQDTREGHEQNRDSMSWVDVRAAGASDRLPVTVPEQHPLYRPPEIISAVAVRCLFDSPEPRAEVTFITSWPAMGRVQYGSTGEYGAEVSDDIPANNHRLYLENLQEGKQYHYRIVVMGFETEVSTEDAGFSVVRPAPVRGTAKRERVMLTAENTAPVPALNCPFTVGLPFPQGRLGDDERMRLLDRRGRDMALQREVTARWPDGSVKWVLLDFIMDVPAQSTVSCTLAYGTDVRREKVDKGVVITGRDEELTVDTGRLRVVFDRRRGGMFQSAFLDADGDGDYEADESVLGSQFPAGAGLTDADGKHLDAIFARPTIEIERPGPLHAIVKVTGTHADAAGSQLFEYIARYHFFAGSSLVKVQHTVGNDRVDETFTTIRSYGIGIPLSFTPLARVTCDAGEGDPVSITASQGNIELTQDLDNHWSLKEPGGVHEGEWGPQAIDVSEGALGLWVGIRHFRETYPSQLTFNRDGMGIGVNLLPPFAPDSYAELGDAVESDRLYYHLREGGYKLHSGVSFTHEVWLGFHRAGDEEKSDWAAHLRQPLIAQAPPAWYCDSGAFGEQLPRGKGRFEPYEDMVERGFAELMRRREANRSYGFLNFGDWWGERGYNWGNIEYDTQHGLMMQFIRTGDRKFFDNAGYAAVHNRDVDFVHYAANPRDVGKTRHHCMFHTGGYEPRMKKEEFGAAYPRTGLTSALSGHQWNRGLFEHYFMTGERRSLETALALGDVMAGQHTTNWSIGHHAERDTAWAIFAVMDAYEATYDPFYLNAAKIQIADVIRKQNPKTGNWGFPAGYSAVEPKPIGGYAWCCGLLISALELYNGHAHDPRVDETILRAAEWLLRDEYVAERRGFRSCSCPTFNQGTRPGQSCWSVSNALAHAYQLSGEERYLDIAQMGFAFYAKGGSGIGKSYSQAICMSPHLIAKLHGAGRDDLDTSRWEPAFELRAPRVLPPGRSTKLPLLLRRARKDPAPVTVQVLEGAKRAASLKGGGQWQLIELRDIKPGVIKAAVTCDGQVEEIRVEALGPEKLGSTGNGVGLIAGEDDYLAPALEALGVKFQRVDSVEQLQPMGVLFFGTQACTLDAAQMRRNPALLLRWLQAGGTAVFSHLNDEGWDPFLLGPALVMQDEDAESGEIATPQHPLFTTPNRVANLAGAKMFDSIAYLDKRWKVLLKDWQGRPAVVECQIGDGRAIVLGPSFERYLTGAIAPATQERADAFRGFVENLLAYVLPSGGR